MNLNPHFAEYVAISRSTDEEEGITNMKTQDPITDESIREYLNSGWIVIHSDAAAACRLNEVCLAGSAKDRLGDLLAWCKRRIVRKVHYTAEAKGITFGYDATIGI